MVVVVVVVGGWVGLALYATRYQHHLSDVPEVYQCPRMLVPTTAVIHTVKAGRGDSLYLVERRKPVLPDWDSPPSCLDCGTWRRLGRDLPYSSVPLTDGAGDGQHVTVPPVVPPGSNHSPAMKVQCPTSDKDSRWAFRCKSTKDYRASK